MHHQSAALDRAPLARLALPLGRSDQRGFYTKADAVEYAKDVSKLGVDWDAIYRPENYAKSTLCRRASRSLRPCAMNTKRAATSNRDKLVLLVRAAGNDLQSVVG
jgi:hypothetical protein